MDEKQTEEIVFKLKKLEDEFQKMGRMVKDASEAFETYQESFFWLESQFALFRRMYWKLKDEMNAVKLPSIDDTAILPPPDPKG